jgi:hypothetical protein
MRPSAVLAIAIGLVAAVANAADLLFLDYFGAGIVAPYILGSFAGVGLLLALLRPGHAVGWLFLAGGSCFALWLTLGAYGWRALVDAPATLPVGELAVWIGSWVLFPAFGSVLVGMLLFPTGRLPSRRWVPILVAVIGALAAGMITDAFAPGPIPLPSPGGPGDVRPDATLPNPFGAGGVLGDALLASKSFPMQLPVLLIVITALGLRFARSSGTERLQLKWFLYAASTSLALIIAAILGPKGVFADLAWASGVVSLGLVPAAVGVAILRYRLYDIDLLVNRTLVYGALSAALAATYFGAVALLQTALRPLTGESEFAVAGSTLAVVALFAPLRRRIQGVVDRRFYRSRYDAARTLDAFGARLRDQVDLDSVRADLLHVVHDTVRPAHASVWLRERVR